MLMREILMRLREPRRRESLSQERLMIPTSQKPIRAIHHRNVHIRNIITRHIRREPRQLSRRRVVLPAHLHARGDFRKSLSEARHALRTSDHALILENAWALWGRTLEMRQAIIEEKRLCVLDGEPVPPKVYLHKVLGVISNKKAETGRSEAIPPDSEESDLDE